MWFFLWDPERDGGKSVSLFWKVEKIQYTLMVIERCQTPPASLPLLLHSLFSLSHHFSPGQSLQCDRGCRLPLMFVTNDFFLLRYVWQRLRCVTPTKSSCSYAGVLNLKKKRRDRISSYKKRCFSWLLQSHLHYSEAAGGLSYFHVLYKSQLWLDTVVHAAQAKCMSMCEDESECFPRAQCVAEGTNR